MQISGICIHVDGDVLNGQESGIGIKVQYHVVCIAGNGVNRQSLSFAGGRVINHDSVVDDLHLPIL